jgi:hypothetical protein
MNRIALGTACMTLAGAIAADATPSTTYWTPAVTDVQPYGVVHVGVDTYTTVFRKTDNGGGDFPADYGVTVGVLPFEKVQLEVGLDLMEPGDYPLLFNAKLGTPEGSLFEGSPALNVGIFNVGTKKGVTDYNVGFALAGMTIPDICRVHAGAYIGNGAILRNSDGEKDNTGFMIGLDRGFLPMKDAAGNGYNRVVVAADYASGDNSIGGGGAGVYYFFTRDISLLAGPVWFNDRGVNGPMKWTVQFDMNL